MEKILNIYKPLGASPLNAIELFRKQNSEYKDVKLGYAGRLDPMAEGVLLVLIGEELKKQRAYWALDKEYEAEILFGFETDTYDILGVPKILKYKAIPENFKKHLKNFEGKFTFEYPPYSSRTVNGKPLFWWARRNKLDEIKIPKKTVEIKNIEFLNKKSIDKKELEKIIIQRINLVQGNFRQKLIKITWKKILKETKQEKFYIIKIRALVSSGTYIRSIAQRLGETLGTGAVLFHLKRTRVDKFIIKNSIKL